MISLLFPRPPTFSREMAIGPNPMLFAPRVHFYQFLPNELLREPIERGFLLLIQVVYVVMISSDD